MHHVGQRFEYLLKSGTFKDPDNTPTEILDILTYTVFVQGQAGLPSWLLFDQKTIRFLGYPGKMDLIDNCVSGMVSLTDATLIKDKFLQPVNQLIQQCQINITMNVSDSIFTISAPFYLYIYNHAPYVNKPIYSQNNSAVSDALYWHVGESYEFTFDSDCFLDKDLPLDTISYYAYTDPEEPLPSFIKFNNKLRKFTGYPLTQHIQCTDSFQKEIQINGKPYESVVRYCPYFLRVVADDSYSAAFNLQEIRVYNTVPLQKLPIYTSTSAQYPNIFLVHVNTQAEYQIPETIFYDVDNNTVLRYSANLQG